MLKALGRSHPVQKALAFVAAHYLRLLRATTRFRIEPADFSARALADAPVIGALWHGQHTMAHFAWPGGMQVAALISRNKDAEINAMVLESLGVKPIRGSGGRNQQLVLAALDELGPQGVAGLVILSGGTDGEDGPTDAAGAFMDEQIARRARELGLDAADYLRRNDAYHFFEQLGGLIKTGPTHTNVCDVRIALVDRVQSS